MKIRELIEACEEELQNIKTMRRQLDVYDSMVPAENRYETDLARRALQNQITTAILNHETLLRRYFRATS